MAHKQYYTEVMGLELPAKANVAIRYMEGVNYFVEWLDAPEGELETLLDGWFSRKAAEEFCRLHGYKICPTKHAPDRLRRSESAPIPLQLSFFADV